VSLFQFLYDFWTGNHPVCSHNASPVELDADFLQKTGATTLGSAAFSGVHVSLERGYSWDGEHLGARTEQILRSILEETGEDEYAEIHGEGS